MWQFRARCSFHMHGSKGKFNEEEEEEEMLVKGMKIESTAMSVALAVLL